MQIWALVPQWAHAYQVAQDAIVGQIYTAHAWCDSNPKKAPKRLFTRFLWAWMGQAKRYGNLKSKPAPQIPRAPEPEPDMTIEEMRAIRERNMRRGVAA